MVRVPKDVGSGAIDWVSSHEIYEQHVREREGQEAPEGQEEDEGHEADDEGDENEDGDDGDRGDERGSEATKTAETTVSYLQCAELYGILAAVCRKLQAPTVTSHRP
jgi:hypothetical protein